jgi:hypothetical protein
MPKRIQNTTEISNISKVNVASKDIAKAEKKPVVASKKEKEEKWARAKLTMGDFFSCHQYLKVVDILGSNIKLENQNGEVLCIDKSIMIQDSYSADHYE